MTLYVGSHRRLVTLQAAAVLLALAVRAAAAAGPPSCRYLLRESQLTIEGGGDKQDGVVCRCRGSAQPGYEGNLNFLKPMLAAVPSAQNSADALYFKRR